VRTVSKRSDSPNSCAAIITLRTNGERGDQCSSIFAVIPVSSNFEKLGINRHAVKALRLSWHLPAFVMAAALIQC
jgi:hypothetical protein